jgi:hypothetical protein
MHLSGFQLKFTILRRVLQVVDNFELVTCQLGHEPIKMQATNGHVLFQLSPATDLRFHCGFQCKLRNFASLI